MFHIKQKLLSSNKPQAFTLVELIITIVILSILSTIAFLSFNTYSSSTRDSVRLSDISSIAKGLVVQYSILGYYILPDSNVSLLSGSTIIGYQGKAGSNVLSTIKISSNSGKDPIDNTYYTYNTNLTKNKYQLSGFLESKGSVINRTSSINNGNSVILSLSKNPFLSILGDDTIRNYNQTISNPLDNQKEISHLHSKGQVNSVIARNEAIHNSFDLNNFNLINQTNATTYTNRYPYMKGDGIGVILSSTGGTGSIVYTPLEDITTSTGIDISSGTLTNGKIVISNNVDSSTGVSVVSMSGYVSMGSSSSNPSCTTQLIYGTGFIIGNPTQANTAWQNTSSLNACYYSGCFNGHTGANCTSLDSNTVLLTHFDGNLINFGSNISTITNNGATFTLGYFSSAMYFNGSNYLNMPSSTDFDFGAGDFTIDTWINFNHAPSEDTILSRDIGTAPYSGNMSWILNLTVSGIGFLYSTDSNNWVTSTRWSFSPVIGTWYHIAVVRNGINLNCYINGIKHTTIVNIGTSTIYNNNRALSLGRYGPDGGYLNGYIDELRISKGIARRTANFTPSIVPY